MLSPPFSRLACNSLRAVDAMRAAGAKKRARCANEEPVPEQEEPEAAAPARSVPTAAELERTEAAAPNLAVPTAGQLELARAKAREASRSKLKPHLLLGLSIEGIEQHIASLPKDAVKQCNDAIPKDAQGAPNYPINSEDNGYTNQFHIAKASEVDELAMCERLQKQGSPHVFKSSGGAPCVLYALRLLDSRKALAAWSSRAVVWSTLNKKSTLGWSH